jgi:Cu2+-exporting ATPase
MHPEVVRDSPGQCPKCGMNLIPVKEENKSGQKHHHATHDHSSHESSHQMHGHDHGPDSGHSHHAGMIDDFKKRFYVVLILTVPIMALSPMIQHWLSVDWSFRGSGYVLLVLSSIVYFYGGWPFLQGLVSEVKTRTLGMMTLVAVAITVAYAYSVAIIFGLSGMDFFWELATLILIMLL